MEFLIFLWLKRRLDCPKIIFKSFVRFSSTMYGQYRSIEMFNLFTTWIVELETLNPWRPTNRWNCSIETFIPFKIWIVVLEMLNPLGLKNRWNLSIKIFIPFMTFSVTMYRWILAYKDLNGIKVRVFFRKNIKKKHLCHHEKNYYYFCESNILVINLIVSSGNMMKLSKNMSL